MANPAGPPNFGAGRYTRLPDGSYRVFASKGGDAFEPYAYQREVRGFYGGTSVGGTFTVKAEEVGDVSAYFTLIGANKIIVRDRSPDELRQLQDAAARGEKILRAQGAGYYNFYNTKRELVTAMRQGGIRVASAYLRQQLEGQPQYADLLRGPKFKSEIERKGALGRGEAAIYYKDRWVTQDEYARLSAEIDWPASPTAPAGPPGYTAQPVGPRPITGQPPSIMPVGSRPNIWPQQPITPPLNGVRYGIPTPVSPTPGMVGVPDQFGRIPGRPPSLPVRPGVPSKPISRPPSIPTPVGRPRGPVGPPRATGFRQRRRTPTPW